MVANLVPENIIISDATVLINFLNTGTFQLLLQAFAGRLHVTDAVVGEITLNRHELDTAIDAGTVVIDKIPIDKINHLAKSFSGFHPGEASCLVLAKEKSWKVATDDGAAKRFVVSDLGAPYLMTTFDILLEMVTLGHLEKDKNSEHTNGDSASVLLPQKANPPSGSRRVQNSPELILFAPALIYRAAI